jgi:hypothetical protein
MEISQGEVAESQEQPGALKQTEHVGRSSGPLESWAQAYPAYALYAEGGPSGEAHSGMERAEIESVYQSPSPNLTAESQDQTPELSPEAQADLAAQRPNYQGKALQQLPLDVENRPLYSSIKSQLTQKYAALGLGPLASPLASARTHIHTRSVTREGAERGMYKKVHGSSPPPTESELNHELRQMIGKRPHKEILEQLKKGAQPAATSSEHQQNAFHKQARSSDPSRRTTDALINYTPTDQLSGAALARDRDGNTPIELAHKGLMKASKRGDDFQRERLTYLMSKLSTAAFAAQPVQDSNEPDKMTKEKKDN